MTAENLPRVQSILPRVQCFNEAAADDRGKLTYRHYFTRFPTYASMRPRPMTAENNLDITRMADYHAGASMRPRPMTAENGAARREPHSGGRELQ